MARSKTPNALQMRELKYGDASEAEQDRVAEDLRASGRRAEALLLYEGRPEHPFLRDEARWAVEQGQAFHLLAVRRMGRDVSPEEIRACAQAAEARGRWMDARNCYVLLEDEEAWRAISEHLPTSLKAPAPVASEE